MQPQFCVEVPESLSFGTILLDDFGKVRTGISNSFINKFCPVCSDIYQNYYHFSNITAVLVIQKNKPIVYADKAFDTKEGLVSYLDDLKVKSSIVYNTKFRVAKSIVIFYY